MAITLASSDATRTARRPWALACVPLLCALVWAGGAFAQATDGFHTSFEAGDKAINRAKGTASLKVDIVGGPSKAQVLTAKPDVGFSGLHSLHYDGAGSGKHEVELFDVDVPVTADTELSYLLFPRSRAGDLHNGATFLAIDLVFDDGSRLSQGQALDLHGTAFTARGQGAARILYPDQWNAVSGSLKAFAGRRVRKIILVHDDEASTDFEGFLDDLRIGDAPVVASTRPTDFVDTRRGSNANGHFSRGNNFPAVAIPHGFNFWTPTTNAGSNWIYQYQERNGADNHPRIEAFSLSHEPSPWMGDRQTFQVMPAIAAGTPTLHREDRAMSFEHANELAQPDYYRVRFDNGVIAEMTPTDHAAIMRFTFPERHAQLIFDNRDDLGGIELDAAAGAISGWSDSKSKLSTGATRIFFYARFDRPVTGSGRLAGEKRDHVAAWFGFDVGKGGAVSMRIATSLIGVDQARHNLEQEIATGDSFESVRERARQAWDKQLGSIAIQTPRRDEKVTLYSNLYRLLLYPNSGYENTGSADAPLYRYASPFAAAAGVDTPTHTGARIVDGKVFVNNGLWDTYRTAWPAYTLLTPTLAGQMIDGFVQQYRDGGWIARWTSPGYADLMVGTSSDVAFADAWLKGVHNFDVASFYQSALKNSAVVSPVAGAGRKGIEHSIFTGYTDTSVDEGLAWSMDGYINDFAIGNLAKALSQSAPAADAYRANYADDAVYYRNRALGYVHLYDPAVDFFVGRNPDGSWRYDREHFDPTRWGGDYTETNAWNMAFHAPQDGAGLAALHGGREAMAKKLDAFFSAPGTFDVGSYGGVIHEMLEARDVRMGQYGHSNQPSHHIIYMYDEVGQPWKTQDKLRDAMNRLYVGGEIGQGYPGDEDNGEMSAWWIFGAAGFYPLRMGTPEYVVGAPRFEHMSIALENGKSIVVSAPGVSDTNRYVQSLRVNGQPWERLTLPHALLAAGATLDFVMGPKPSRWGSDPSALPASLTADGQRPAPLQDVTTTDRVSVQGADAHAVAALADDDSTTAFAFSVNGTVDYSLARPARVAIYTITSPRDLDTPSGWQVEGSADGKHWTVLDQRRNELFAWHQQTRAFVLPKPAAFAHYRIVFGDVAHRGIAEIELLAGP
jgi:predicted alpha-1,2-mannosidase